MNSVPKISRWQVGRVDRRKEHFELRYGSAQEDNNGWTDWLPIALVGPPKSRVVNVQFLVEPKDSRNAEATKKTQEEIQFYLIDKEEDDPWSYAIYHCGTGANIYSMVHWSFFLAQKRVRLRQKLKKKPARRKYAKLTKRV
jgi:hypothetical protein